MDSDLFVRILLVTSLILFFLRQYGYKDKFPCLGKTVWRDRPHYQEVAALVFQKAYQMAGTDLLPNSSIYRLEGAVDKVLKAIEQEHEVIQIHVPHLATQRGYIDFRYEIKANDVKTIQLKD